MKTLASGPLSGRHRRLPQPAAIILVRTSSRSPSLPSGPDARHTLHSDTHYCNLCELHHTQYITVFDLVKTWPRLAKLVSRIIIHEYPSENRILLYTGLDKNESDLEAQQCTIDLLHGISCR